jgi:IS1 family transposase
MQVFYICSMNTKSVEEKAKILQMLVEGNSMRSVSRMADCSINTVTKLLVDVGKACQDFHDKTVVKVRSERVQCDEIWSFVYAKQKNVPEQMKEEGVQAGDVWTWTAIDADSKLIISWMVGNRDAVTAYDFMLDVSSRLYNRVQLTTDGHRGYLAPVDDIFGTRIDYAQLIKIYGNSNEEYKGTVRYSPGEVTGIEKKVRAGSPDPDHISTSFVERQNLTMRMHMRRFTRLTNGHSKKIENHCYAIALHFVYYNFCKIHKTLRVTPAMEAGLTKDIMSLEDVVRLTEKA